MTTNLEKYEFNEDSSFNIDQDEYKIQSSKNSKIFLKIDYNKSLYRKLNAPSEDLIDYIVGKSETEMSMTYGDAYSEMVDADRRKRYAYLPFCGGLYTSSFEKKEDIEKKDSLKIAVDTNAASTDHSSAFDETAKENLFKQVEEKIIEINKKIIGNAIDSNTPFKLEENKFTEIENVKDGGALTNFSTDNDGKYLSDKHISHIVSVVAIEYHRAFDDKIDTKDKIEKSVDNVKEAFNKVSTLDIDTSFKLMKNIKVLSDQSALKDENGHDIELGVGIGRSSTTRMKVAHYAKNDTVKKEFNNLLGTDLSPKDLTALLIIISKSIQLTNQLVAHFQDDEHNVPSTLDKMIIEKPSEYEYGILGTPEKKGKFIKVEKVVTGLDISGVERFNSEIIKRVDLAALETAANAGDEAFSSVDSSEQRGCIDVDSDSLYDGSEYSDSDRESSSNNVNAQRHRIDLTSRSPGANKGKESRINHMQRFALGLLEKHERDTVNGSKVPGSSPRTPNSSIAEQRRTQQPPEIYI